MTSRVLSTRGEQEWVRLRRHLDRSRGFWLGIVLTEDAIAADILRERARANRRGRAEHFVTLRAADPAELGGILDALESDGAPPRGCTWVTAPLLPDPEWLAAWRRAFRSLNHRRDVLRDRMGGLVIVAPGAVKVDAQREASDLWSVRDLLVELRIERPRGEIDQAPSTDRSEIPRPEGAAGLRLGEVVSNELADEVAVLLAMTDEELAGAARIRGATATETAIDQGDEQTAAVLLLRRGLAAEAAGDLAGALDLIRVATGLDEVDEQTSIGLNDAGAEIAHALEDLPSAHAFALRSLRREEERQVREPSVEASRRLAVSLDRVGRIEYDRRDLVEARARFSRILALQKQADAEGSPEADRVGHINALTWCGMVEWALGALVEARVYFQRAVRSSEALASDRSSEALGVRARAHDRLGMLDLEFGNVESARVQLSEVSKINEQQITEHGAPPWRIAYVLGRLGNLELNAGEMAAARERLARSLALRQERVDQSNSLAALDELARGLRDLGDADRSLDDLDSARNLYTQAVAIGERLAELGTDSARLALCLYLGRLADVELELGDSSSAHGLFLRSEAIAADLSQRRPPDTEVLGLLVFVLGRLALIDRSNGDLAAARTRLVRAVHLAGERAATLGTPESLRKAAEALTWFAEVEAMSRNLESTRRSLLRAVSVWERLADESRTPRAITDLSEALVLLAIVERELGDSTSARVHLARAVGLADQLATRINTATQWHRVRRMLRDLVELSDGTGADGYNAQLVRARLADVESILARLDDTPDG